MAQARERRFIFPITTGRSGTVYLAELLRRNLTDAEVHHERLGFLDLGVETPDASHFTRFNTLGNAPEVRAFWRRKLERLRGGAPGRPPPATYVEISHPLIKAGLAENIAPLAEAGTVHFIILKRDVEAILWSLVNRFDFANLGFTWLFYLDPRYPNVLLDPAPFRRHGMAGCALWYIHEMFTRAEYYRLLLGGHPNLRFHDLDLAELQSPEGAARLLADLGASRAPEEVRAPGRRNESRAWHFGEDMRKRLPSAGRADGCGSRRRRARVLGGRAAVGRAAPGCTKGQRRSASPSRRSRSAINH